MNPIDYMDRIGKSGPQSLRGANILDEIRRVSRQMNLRVLTVRLVDGVGWALVDTPPDVPDGCLRVSDDLPEIGLRILTLNP